MTVPSLFSGIFMATNLCEEEKNTLCEKKKKKNFFNFHFWKGDIIK